MFLYGSEQIFFKRFVSSFLILYMSANILASKAKNLYLFLQHNAFL